MLKVVDHEFEFSLRKL